MLFVALLLVACGEKPSPEAAGSPSPEPSATGPVLTADPRAEVGYPSAQLPGRLTVRDGCLALDGAPTLWPAGTRWDGQARAVVLPDGRRLSVGTTVTLGGGLVPTSVVASYSATAGDAIEECMGALGASEVALISG